MHFLLMISIQLFNHILENYLNNIDEWELMHEIILMVLMLILSILIYLLMGFLII